MGFDDRCWDVGDKGLSAMIEDILVNNDILDCYSMEQQLTIEVLESYEAMPPKYNGYSLAFHILFPVHYTYAAGNTPPIMKVNETFVRRETRIQVLKKLKEMLPQNSVDVNLGCVPDVASVIQTIDARISDARAEQEQICKQVCLDFEKEIRARVASNETALV